MSSARVNIESSDKSAEIGEDLIFKVVHAFYARVRTDELIGPIFEHAVEDWPSHLDKLCRFWSSVILTSGTYRGQPLQVHLKLQQLDDEHFLRWLGLFQETVEGLCTPGQADIFMNRAERIADSFRFGLATAHGKFASPLRRTRP